MSAIRVKARVPENRQVTVTITLPPEVAVGDAELEIVVREPGAALAVPLPASERETAFPARPTHPQLAVEFDAFERMLPDLMRAYAGKFVALRDGAVVAVAATKTEALTAAAQRFPGELLYARLVTDRPQPIPYLPSLRTVPRGE